MANLLWDSSALVKRFAPEPGSDVVDALFDPSLHSRMISTMWGYAEAYAILSRKRNSKIIAENTFTAAVTALRRVVLINPNFALLAVNDGDVLSALTHVERHNINTVDAAMLAVFLEFAISQPIGSTAPVLISSDKRLLRAAEAEGLKTLNPEMVSAADVPVVIASLL